MLITKSSHSLADNSDPSGPLGMEAEMMERGWRLGCSTHCVHIWRRGWAHAGLPLCKHIVPGPDTGHSHNHRHTRKTPTASSWFHHLHSSNNFSVPSLKQWSTMHGN